MRSLTIPSPHFLYTVSSPSPTIAVVSTTYSGTPIAAERLAPERSAPWRSAPVRSAPERLALGRSAQGSLAPERSALERSTFALTADSTDSNSPMSDPSMRRIFILNLVSYSLNFFSHSLLQLIHHQVHLSSLTIGLPQLLRLQKCSKSFQGFFSVFFGVSIYNPTL